MTKYIIIEDERLAYEEIRRMMQRLRPDYTLVGWAGYTATHIGRYRPDDCGYSALRWIEF